MRDHLYEQFLPSAMRQSVSWPQIWESILMEPDILSGDIDETARRFGVDYDRVE